MTNFKVW